MDETIKLMRAVKFDGKEIKEIPLDLEGLNGQDMLSVERQYFRAADINQANALKELSKEYQVYVAARASKMPVEFFYQISAKDFSRITIKVQRFLLEEDSEVE